MASTMDKIMLSASADGDGIRISTASPIDGSDTTIHTAGAGTTDLDLVTLFASNAGSTMKRLHVKWGDTTDSIIVPVEPQAGLVLIVADLPISDSNVVTASAETVDVITVFGYVNRIDKP